MNLKYTEIIHYIFIILILINSHTDLILNLYQIWYTFIHSLIHSLIHSFDNNNKDS